MDTIPSTPQGHGRGSDQFDALALPTATLPSVTSSRYQIRDKDGTVKAVEADSAAKAIKESGIAQPVFVKREMPGNQVLVNITTLLG